MRIALYGTDEEKLEGHKQRLHKSIVGIGDTVLSVVRMRKNSKPILRIIRSSLWRRQHLISWSNT